VPLILKDVPKRSRCTSTISRSRRPSTCIPARVFEFRYFLSSHVEAADGTEMSSTAIRAKIKK